MSYVVAATWKARPGQGERVRAAIARLIEPSRAEPGCRFYQPGVDPADADHFLIYEIYDDEAAYRAHGASPHFRRFALEVAIPLLESRERRFFLTFDA
jgi:quinol monooxygenase YgiN